MSHLLSPKQLDSFQNSDSRINIWEGAVRSGKTFASILRFICALKDGPPGNAMIIGVSRESIQRNIILELCTFLGIPFPTPKATQMNIFNRIVFLVGANDERAQRKIKGSTLTFAYVDEVTEIPRSFFQMLLSRLSQQGAQLFGTTNPDSPFHWLKTDFLEKDTLDLRRFRFELKDNPHLTQDYINNLKSEYTGLWYKRFIEGQWVLAEGTVYDFFDEDEHVINVPPGPAQYYIVGIDYGTQNPTVFTMVGYNNRFFPNMWIEKEYYYDSRKAQRQKTDTEYAEDLLAFINHYNVSVVYVDPSASSFKVEMAKQGINSVSNAQNDVLNGIRLLSKILNNGTLKICSNCKKTIEEFETYRWDEKACIKGEDRPLKENDHAMDSLRYAVYSHFGKGIEEEYTEKEINKMWESARGVQQDLPHFFRDEEIRNYQYVR